MVSACRNLSPEEFEDLVELTKIHMRHSPPAPEVDPNQQALPLSDAAHE